MHPSGHIDSFARDNLPPQRLWPRLECCPPLSLAYPERLNCAAVLLDDALRAGHGSRPAIHHAGGTWTYFALADAVDRMAHALVRDLGLRPGNRVLLRGTNGPMMAAAWLAVVKAGGIAVATMPLLRARELAAIVDKAEVDFCLYEKSLQDELDRLPEFSRRHLSMLSFGERDASDSVERLMESYGEPFRAAETAADDVCLIAFTSGTTGKPKGTMHFHRDVLAICDCFPAHVLRPGSDDVFIGSPPLAFTFGLGGLLLFPMRMFASTVLLPRLPPDALVEAIARHRATVCFTAPTAYRAMLDRFYEAHSADAVASLRKCVSAGEALPAPTFDSWRRVTGLTIIDGIGATEMLHIFISADEREMRAGATGKAIPGYDACILDEDGRPVRTGEIGRLAVRGPTGCRYLADDRQAAYVRDGWNLTGDAYRMDEDGYFIYQARTDDMIVSSGYNIAGPEVEAALLEHPDVKDCAVIGAPDPQRGQIVKAFVILREGVPPEAATAKALQDHVKQAIAPFKYPRAVAFVDALPRTETGKVQRFRLRQGDAAPPATAPPAT